MLNVSEFAHELGQIIMKPIYDGLYWVCEKGWNKMFSFLDSQIGDAAQMLQKTPERWNFNAYTIIKTIANEVITPLAAIFIACILAWELVHLLQESNQMGGQIFEKLIMLCFMSVVCTYVVSHSFEIVMFFFRLGASVTDKIADVSALDVAFQNISLDSYLPEVPAEGYSFRLLLEMAGNAIILWLGNLAVIILSVLIYIRCTVWFLEFLLYAAVASIPNATWMSREWSQVGMNYTRKMLAIAFEGPLMLLLFAMYGFVIKGVNMGDFTQSLIMIIGCGFALWGMMGKVGNISASIFNAH